MGRRSSDSLKKKRAKTKQTEAGKQQIKPCKKQAHKQGKIHKQKTAKKIHAGCGITAKARTKKTKQRKTKIRWAVGQAVER